MSWAIIADSSCNLRDFKPSAPETSYAVAPLKINVGGVEYVDDDALDVADLNRKVAAEDQATSSSCPSIGEWSELFRTADNVIAITISANLSGSFEAAIMARNLVLEEGPRNIHVVNSRAAGGKLEYLVIELDRYLAVHPEATFEDACAFVDEAEATSQVLFSLCSYENLSKSGRMPKMAGVLANKLSIRVLGTASPEGTIKVVAPTRSQRKMFDKVVQGMEADGYHGGLVCIDHVFDEGAAQALADRIHVSWPDAEVRTLCCGGLCSYYAERDGLIIGYGWGSEL